MSRSDPKQALINAPVPDADPASSKKRRREPDWNDFYRNGLPEEIIVIEDSPEPTANIGRKLINVASSSAAPPPSKKRRKDPVVTPRRDALDPNISSERTSATLNTTAPTSLSSNGQRDEAVASFEHKRTTRRRTAAEAKRKALDNTGALFATYEPPPKPPKKVSNVHVRTIQDVSCHLLLIHLFSYLMAHISSLFHSTLTKKTFPRWLTTRTATTSSSPLRSLPKSVCPGQAPPPPGGLANILRRGKTSARPGNVWQGRRGPRSIRQQARGC